MQGTQGAIVGPGGPFPEQGLSKRGLAAIVIAVVISLTGLAAVLILVSTPSSSPPSPCEKFESMPVQFTEVILGGTPPYNNSAQWEVSCVRKSIADLSFRVRMMKEYELLTPDNQTLQLNRVLSFGPLVRLTMTDSDRNGRLTRGDAFFVHGMEDHHDWRLLLEVEQQHWGSAGQVYWDTHAIPPTITLSTITYGGAPPNDVAVSWDVESSEASTFEFSFFAAKIKKDGTSLTLTSQRLHAGAAIEFGSYVKMEIDDAAGDGNLSAWDVLMIRGLDEGHSWEFSLEWHPTSVVLFTDNWRTDSPSPVISFSVITKDFGGSANYTARWWVVGVSYPVYDLSSFRVGIEMDGVQSSFKINLTGGAIIELGSQVKLIFGELTGDDRLSIGDSFFVFGMGEPHTWRFKLYWTGDLGNPLSQAWSTP